MRVEFNLSESRFEKMAFGLGQMNIDDFRLSKKTKASREKIDAYRKQAQL